MIALVNKKVLVGVTGGIAAYKTCILVRELKKLGADVRVAMTRSACEFVSELTFASLSERPVVTSLFTGIETGGTTHIDLARWCDLFVVCPATANFLAKAACGIADDFLTTSLLATQSQVIICPAMNSVMWEKPAVQQNAARLKEMGYEIVEPEYGALATASEGTGWGRLADNQSIVDQIRYSLLATDELAGHKVVVTAGPTREVIDPVRFLTNYSTGKMGFALAEAAMLRGANVVLISGPNNLHKPLGIKYVEIVSAAELRAAVINEYADCDILLMSAAVADYRPHKVFAHKFKKQGGNLGLQMEKNPDILAELGLKKGQRIHVGFAIETQNGVTNATRKLETKNLDFIVLNNPLQAGAAFAGDTNIVSIISPGGTVKKLPKMSKQQVAFEILDRVCKQWRTESRKQAAG